MVAFALVAGILGVAIGTISFTPTQLWDAVQGYLDLHDAHRGGSRPDR